MKRSPRRTAAALGAAALMALTGCGATTASQTAGAGGAADPMTALAERLGVSPVKVREAMRSVLSARGPPGGGAPKGGSPPGDGPGGTAPQGTETPSAASPS